MDGAAYTPRQLLANTSGLPDYGPLPAYGQAVCAGDAPWPRDGMLNRALSGGKLRAALLVHHVKDLQLTMMRLL